MKYDNELMTYLIIPIVGFYLICLGYTYYVDSSIWVYKYILGIGILCTGCFLLIGDGYLIYHTIKKFLIGK